MPIKRIRNNLREWDRLPEGYELLPPSEPVQALDVQRINDEWYCEYPKDGCLIGKLRGAGGMWYRHKSLPTEKMTLHAREEDLTSRVKALEGNRK